MQRGAKRFVDIGANLTDPMFRGVYNSKEKHKPDIQDVLNRAWNNGLERIIITGGSLMDCEEAVRISKKEERLFCTIGCHPTACKEIEQSGDPEKYIDDLRSLALKHMDKVIAVGECGLDYARLHFCPKETQKRFFEMQLDLVQDLRRPLFLHCRDAASDLMEILDRNRDRLLGGVVHSFDGTEEEAAAFVDKGFYIGINGCSLKTQQNLQVVATIPIERLLIETDCPWCEVRPSHAGYKFVKTHFESFRKDKWKYGKMVKGRSEPSHILQVFEILAAIREEPAEALCDILYENAENLFFRY